MCDWSSKSLSSFRTLLAAFQDIVFTHSHDINLQNKGRKTTKDPHQTIQTQSGFAADALNKAAESSGVEINNISIFTILSLKNFLENIECP